MKREYIDPSVFVRVWSEAEISVWAVNIASSGKFGRSLEKDALDIQKSAVRRGVSVTRVFVLEENEPSEAREHLRKVVKAQLEIGISVFVISRLKFEGAKGQVQEELGSDDFVVVDDKTIYVSDPGGKYILNRPGNLIYAYAVTKQIQRAANKVGSHHRIHELIPVS